MQPGHRSSAARSCGRSGLAAPVVLGLAFLAVAGCSTGVSLEPCASVECSSHGYCFVQGNDPLCACIPGFHPRSLACVANDGCNGVDCTGHGICTLGASGPECDCLPGYRHPLDYALHCVPDPEYDGAGRDDGVGTDDGIEDAETAGCEAGATEACNGRDDDCDGLTDETFDLDFDSWNCGSCGHACTSGAHGRATCVLAECAVTCDAGWSDLDGDPTTGCEAGCTPVSTPDESICEGRDDDCDGLTDEDWAAATTCGFGACERYAVCFRGSDSCRPRTPPAATDPTCDGLDDDCDGVLDEDAVGCAADADADAPDAADADADVPDAADADDATEAEVAADADTADVVEAEAEAEASLCGNGRVDPGEACDDNSRDCGECGSQGCRADCTWDTCDDPGMDCSHCDPGRCWHDNTGDSCGGCLRGTCSDCYWAGTSYDVPCAGGACTYYIYHDGEGYDCHCP